MNTLEGKIHVDFRSNVPLYLQIAHQIEQLVQQGDLKVGDQLPTVRELATELRINFNTVTRAYRVLDETRLISTQRGRGTYIWEKVNEEQHKVMRDMTLQGLAARFLEEAKKLGYSPEEIIETLKSLIQGNGSNIETED